VDKVLQVQRAPKIPRHLARMSKPAPVRLHQRRDGA
jgi:hypothetical protein